MILSGNRAAVKSPLRVCCEARWLTDNTSDVSNLPSVLKMYER